MSIKGIIFDADGVLLDSMGIWDQAPEMYLRSKGITPEKHLGQKMFAMSMTEGAEYIKKHYLVDFPVTKILDGQNALDFCLKNDLDEREVVIIKYNLDTKRSWYSVDYENFVKINFDDIKNYI